MCEPISLSTSTLATMALATSAVSTAAGVGSAVVGTINQNQQYKENARSAMDAHHLKVAQLNLRQRQEAVQASQKKEDARLKRLRSQGTANAAADAGNVKGVSVQRLLDDYTRSEAVYNDRLNQNLEASKTQAGFQNRAFAAERDRRISSVQPAGMEKIFGAVVSAGTQALSAYGDYSEAFDNSDLED